MNYAFKMMDYEHLSVSAYENISPYQLTYA